MCYSTLKKKVFITLLTIFKILNFFIDKCRFNFSTAINPKIFNGTLHQFTSHFTLSNDNENLFLLTITFFVLASGRLEG